jgi:hypothetical protein
MSQKERRPGKAALHNKHAMSSGTIAEDQEKKFRQDTLTAIVREAKRQGHHPTRELNKILRGQFVDIAPGGVSRTSQDEVAKRIPSKHGNSKTGHMNRKQVRRGLAWWAATGLIEREWVPIMLSSGQASGKWVYRVARHIMSILKAAGKLIRRPRRKNVSYLLQRLYRDSGMGRVAAIPRPQPSLADLIRKYFGDEAANVYMAVHTEGEECQAERECNERGQRGRSFTAKFRMRLARAWRRLIETSGSYVHRGFLSKFPTATRLTPESSTTHAMEPEW